MSVIKGIKGRQMGIWKILGGFSLGNCFPMDAPAAKHLASARWTKSFCPLEVAGDVRQDQLKSE